MNNTMTVVDTIEINGVHVERSVLACVHACWESAIATMSSMCTTIKDGVSTSMLKIGDIGIVVRFTAGAYAVVVTKKGKEIYASCAAACGDVWSWLKSLFVNNNAAVAA